MSSCEREDPNDQGNEGRLTEATLTFRVPGSTLPGTRALEEDNHDRDIKEVTVLVFQGGKYLYPRTGKITDYPTDQSSEIKFKVTLATGTYDLVILANAEAILTACYPTGIPAETTKAAVASAMEMTLGETNDTTGESDKWNTNTSTTTYHIPMWGELVDAVIPETGETIGFTTKRDLTRMVAKVDITIQADILPTTFTLTEVHFFNYQRRGILIPDITKYTAKTPTLPATQLGLTGSDRGQKWGDGAAAIPDNQLTGEIFTFAAPAGADYRFQPCVIVGGKYKGSSKNTYYRIDFIGADGEHLPLLRNHKYDMVVTKISGEGYVDVPTAYSSRPMNLKSQVMFWNESDMSDVVFDGVNFMSVSPGEFEISQLGVTTADNHIITVATDVDVIDGKNWTAKIYHDEAGNNEMTADNDQWLYLDKNYDNKVYNPNDPSTKSQVVLTADASTDSDARIAWIHFKAGRLIYIVQVTQLNYAPAYVWITDENGNSISSLTFTGGNPQPKKFRVTWSPKTQPLQIERIHGVEKFEDTGSTKSLTALPPGGSYELEIVPQPFSESELKENPFKATSTILQFAIGDALGKVSEASINLRQMDYKIVPEGFKDGYVGYGVTAGVKSNARWNLSVIDGASLLSSTPITSGSANTSSSTALNYTFASSGSGEVTFRFSSPDRLFEDYDIKVELVPIGGLFAKSNIVYKDGKLAFAEIESDNNKIPANSQGIYFKHGSLVGIASDGGSYTHTESDDYGGTYRYTVPYVPFDMSHIIYKPTEFEGSITNYDEIPYFNFKTSYNNNNQDHFIATYGRNYINSPTYNGGYDSEAALGDICRYMSDKGLTTNYRWRTPTYGEYMLMHAETIAKLNSYDSGLVFGTFIDDNEQASGNGVNGNYGLYKVTSGLLTGGGIEPEDALDNNQMTNPGKNRVFFPTSGFLYGASGGPSDYRFEAGALFFIGDSSVYPTTVPNNSNAIFTGSIHSDGINTNSPTAERTAGLPVRCIRDGILNSQ